MSFEHRHHLELPANGVMNVAPLRHRCLSDARPVASCQAKSLTGHNCNLHDDGRSGEFEGGT